MTTPAFPAYLKPVVSQGYSFGTANNVIEQPVEGGLPLMILDYRTSMVAFDVVLVLTPFKFQVWSDFYYSKIDSGSAKFTMTLDAANGLESCTCNLVPSSVSQTTQNQLSWIVSFTVLAESTAAQEDPFEGNLSDLYNLYGDDILTIIDAIEALALVDLPEIMA
jgi:hypothetical protein